MPSVLHNSTGWGQRSVDGKIKEACYCRMNKLLLVVETAGYFLLLLIWPHASPGHGRAISELVDTVFK